MIKVLIGDCLARLRELSDESVHCCITSPPYYGLRCYGVEGQIGLEPTPEEHIAKLVEVFRDVRRVLRKDGTLWLNYGDAYNAGRSGGWAGGVNGISRPEVAQQRSGANVPGLKPKDLLMMPARVALALQADGWWLRSMLPWVKRSAMPESVTDRPATAIEYVFLLAKSPRYFFDMEAVRQAWNPKSVARMEAGLTARTTFGSGNHAMNRDGAYDGDTTGRNFRNSDLFYASLASPHGLICGAEPLALDVNPAAFSDAHFATFPPKLVEPLIKAGTSERGVCAECGAPWVREVDVTRTFESGSGRAGNMPVGKNGANLQGGGETLDVRRGPTLLTKTTGWSPACACDAATVPAVVLDPFGGAGTVGLVADRLGRDALLIELNPEYAEMAKSRIRQDAGMFADLVASDA